MMEYTFSDEKFDLSDFLNAVSYDDQGRAIVLFGAAGWGETLLDELKRRGYKQPFFFADNDVTKQGHMLKDIPILSPGKLSPHHHQVIITTISAGDAVSDQLERMGFVRGGSYFEVMHNRTAVYPVNVVSFFLGLGMDVPGKTILHVGPGGNLGVEVIFAALGAKRVVSIDYNSYGMSYPDVSKDDSFYREIATLTAERFGVNPFNTDVLLNSSEETSVNTDKIEFRFPCSVSCMPFPDDTFDYVLHHAVLEHVADLASGYREIARVLKEGGRTYGLVDPQDHRQFASYKDYHPLKFLEYSRDQWMTIAKNINYHNQCPTPMHLEYIAQSGLIIDTFEPVQQCDPTPFMGTFSPEFQVYSPKDLGILRFSFSAFKHSADTDFTDTLF